MLLSQPQSLSMATVLEDCSDQLDVLGHTLTVAIRRERGPAVAQERTRLTKLRRDCEYIKQLFSELLLELEQKQSFTSLQQVVQVEEQRKEAKKIQREAQRELDYKIQSLRRHQEELQQKTDRYEDLCQLAKDLKHQLDEQSFEAEMWRKFVAKETELQIRLAHKKIIQAEQEQEEALMEQLELLQMQLKEEKTLHGESMTFLQSQHEDLQRERQKWQQHTEQMLQDKQEHLNRVCCKKTINMDKLSEMRRMFREMEMVVMVDRRRQEKVNYELAKVKSAIRVQAWWRGTMVRKEFAVLLKAERAKVEKEAQNEKDKKKKK